MSEAPVPPRATPNRRRNGRAPAKAAVQKAYASENDAAAMNPHGFHDIPQTPEKNGTPAASRNNAQNSHASKSRSNNNKTKPRNAQTSPDSALQAQQITPQRASSMSTSKANMAFAGATFHASPAPSALPMPSFFTKSSNESPGPRSLDQPVQEPSPPATDTDVPTPNRAASASKTNGSPLDFMFRAHREEKERERRGSTLSQKPVMGATLSPFQSPTENDAPRGAQSVPHTRKPLVRHASAGRIDSEELDGSQGLPMGPAFSTPYQDRIRAARSNQSRPSPTQAQSPSQQPDSASLEDRTEALKKFLFSGGFAGTQQTNAASHASNNFGSSQQPSMARGGYSSAAPSNQAQPQPEAPGRTTEIQAMENDLRRILKLSPGTTGGATERTLF